jgi:hypothetical protein
VDALIGFNRGSSRNPFYPITFAFSEADCVHGCCAGRQKMHTPTVDYRESVHLEFTFQEIVNAAHEAGMFGPGAGGERGQGQLRPESRVGEQLRQAVAQIRSADRRQAVQV